MTGSRRYNIPLNLWLVAITRKHKQHNQDRRYNIQKSQEKTSTTKTRATHNQHNEDWRYIPLNLLLVATGCKVHCGRLGALWVARCIVGAWRFCDKKVAHVLQRHACPWVETRRTDSASYPMHSSSDDSGVLISQRTDKTHTFQGLAFCMLKLSVIHYL